MARIFFLAIALYLAYRLIFDLIVPVYKTTKHVKRQFNNMQDHMQQSNHNQNQSSNNNNHTDKKEKVGEYIDFEEVK